MTKRTPSKTKHKKQSPLAALSLLAVACAVCGLAFLSMELAFLAVGYLGVCTFMLIDHKRRKHWEMASGFKLHLIAENHDRLVREVARQGEDLAVLKENNARASHVNAEQETLSHAPASAQASAPKAPLSQRPATKITAPKRKPARRESKSFHKLMNMEILPRAFTPKKSNRANKKTSANDELLDEHMNLSDIVVTELIHNTLQNRKIEVFMQPIVRLPTRKVRAYEVFGRIRARAGVYIPAGRYKNIAQEEEMMHDLDHLLLMECLDTIKKTAHIENATPFFVNVTSDTLRNGLFMKQLLRFVAQNRTLAKRLVLEIPQNNFDDMQPAIMEILRGLTALGCSLSLDHVQHLNFDTRLFQAMRLRYVKISASTASKLSKNYKSLRDLYKSKRQLEGNGIAVIIERVEKESALREFLDFDFQYGQGHLFGRAELQGVYRQQEAA